MQINMQVSIDFHTQIRMQINILILTQLYCLKLLSEYIYEPLTNLT